MLKFTYTEADLYIKYLDQSLEEFITCRILLAMRLGLRLIIEPGTAAILLPSRVERVLLEFVQDSAIDHCYCDADMLEVRVSGTWLAQDGNVPEGLFIVELSDRTERLLLKLWQESRSYSMLPR
jgi:hypothetical protein